MNLRLRFKITRGGLAKNRYRAIRRSGCQLLKCYLGSSAIIKRCFRSKTLLSLAGFALLINGEAFAYSSYGLGNLSCTTYLERRGEDQHSHSLENTSYIHAYLSGYLTAGNMMRGLVDEHVDDISINIHRFVQWLDAKCGDRKDAQVATALEEFWVEAAKAQEVIKRKSSSPQN